MFSMKIFLVHKIPEKNFYIEKNQRKLPYFQSKNRFFLLKTGEYHTENICLTQIA